MQAEADISYAARFLRVFAGFNRAYGTYDATVQNADKGGKLEIRASARTIRATVSQQLWNDHLEGAAPLGVIPIRENNTCLWGAIDVDQYDVSLQDVARNVERNSLPLVPCRTKSGGAHLYLFLAEPAPADAVRARLKEMSALLGYGDSEIFPKQNKVDLDRGDLGSWLNMPYFGGEESDRYAVKENGLGMTVGEFLSRAESLAQPRNFLEQSFRKKPDKDPEFGDGPPCMQHLAAEGLPEGGRNQGLFAFAAFAKKKFGARWEQVVEDWNRRFVDPPLPSTEVVTIIKAHEKKDYNYPCKQHPIAAHCNSSLCRTRRYGVGGEDDFPAISGLSVLGVEPPLWFLDVNDQRLELHTDELLNYRLFHKVCAERLYICFRTMKASDWNTIVSSAMRTATRLDAPEEIGDSGHFMELLEEYVSNRHRGDEPSALLLGKPYFDADGGRHYFRLKDLTSFLEKQGFTLYNRPQIVSRIRSLGGDKKFFNILDRGVNSWWIPAMFKSAPKLSLPETRGEPI